MATTQEILTKLLGRAPADYELTQFQADPVFREKALTASGLPSTYQPLTPNLDFTPSASGGLSWTERVGLHPDEAIAKYKELGLESTAGAIRRFNPDATQPLGYEELGDPQYEALRQSLLTARNAPATPAPVVATAPTPTPQPPAPVSAPAPTPQAPLGTQVPPPTGTQPTQPTQPAPENIPLSQSGQYYKIGNDVYRASDNQKIDLNEFHRLGLNFKFIPERTATQQPQQPQAPQQGAPQQPQAPGTPQAGAPAPSAGAPPTGGVAVDPTIASIQAVFGPQWQPSPAFTPDLQKIGVYGAVRIAGHDEVYTLGPGGTHETPESYQEKFGTLAQEGIVGEVSVDQARRLGILVKDDGAPTNTKKEDLQKTPFESFKDLYKELFEDSGLGGIKDQLANLQKELQTVDKDFADEVAKINENPWLSESLRVRKVNAVTEKHNLRRSQIADQVTAFQGIYDSGKQDIQFVAGQYLQQTNSDRTFDLNYLKFLSDAAETEAKLGLEERELEIRAQREGRLGGGGGGAPITIKPPTAAQELVAGYAVRLEQANPTLKTLTNTISNMSALKFGIQLKLPSNLQSSEIQQYMQASRNFINAVLRRESGAVISPTEFSEAQQQYLPKPGDSSETLRLKEANRNLVFNSLKNAAGSAYSSVGELLGEVDEELTLQDYLDWGEKNLMSVDPSGFEKWKEVANR